MRRFYLLALWLTVAAAALADGVITTQPEGTVYQFMRSADVISRGNYEQPQLVSQTVDGATATIVVDGNTMYIKNPFSLYEPLTEGWLVGHIEGDRVVVQLPQLIYENDYVFFKNSYYARRMVPNEENTNLVDDTEGTDIEFQWKDQVLTQLTPAYLALCDANDWYGYADKNIVMKDGDAEQPVSVPDEVAATAEDYAFQYSLEETSANGHLVKVAFDGNDIYVRNLYPAMPDSWVKGTIDGAHATFASQQYLGKNAAGNDVYFMTGDATATYNSLFDETFYEDRLDDQPIVFDYDADAHSLRSGRTIIINQGKLGLNALQSYHLRQIKKFEVRPDQVPVEPKLLIMSDFNETYGEGYITFKLEKIDTNGDYIDEPNFFYNIYIDDEIMTFEKDLYTGLSEDMVDIPYNFLEKVHYAISPIDTWGHRVRVSYYTTGFEAIGVQALFKAGDVVNRSTIAYFYAGGTAVKAPEAGAKVVDVCYFDLSGRRLTSPARGLSIRRITYDDGTVQTQKVR